MADRKLVSWRIENLEPNQRDVINDWLDAQSNIQLSLTSLALHMIEHFGYTDIMSFDVQKTLYIQSNTIPAVPVVSVPTPKPVEQTPIEEDESEEIKVDTTFTEALPEDPPKAEQKVEQKVEHKVETKETPKVEQKPAPVAEQTKNDGNSGNDDLYDDLHL